MGLPRILFLICFLVSTAPLELKGQTEENQNNGQQKIEKTQFLKEEDQSRRFRTVFFIALPFTAIPPAILLQSANTFIYGSPARDMNYSHLAFSVLFAVTLSYLIAHYDQKNYRKTLEKEGHHRRKLYQNQQSVFPQDEGMVWSLFYEKKTDWSY